MFTEIDETVKLYTALGVGGVSFVVIVGLLIYFVSKINPTLTSLEKATSNQNSLIGNNTRAIQEMSRSNDNIANALILLKISFETLNNNITEHDERSKQNNIEFTRKLSDIKKCVLETSVRTERCLNNKQ